MDDINAGTGSTTSESTEIKSTESTGQGTVEPQGSQEQTDNAGGEQSSSEGGKEQGTDTRQKPFRSKNQTIYELRQGLRERDRQIQDLNTRFSQFEQKFQSRGQERKPSRTFWEAPEEVLDERITGHLSEMEKRIFERMESRDTQFQQTSQMREQALEAAKLIKSQKGITEDDINDIREMLSSDPVLQRLTESPMEQAEYALFKWQQLRGIQDKTGLKNKSVSVQSGAPVAGGKRQWTKTEMEGELKKFPPDPKSWTADHEKRWKELDSEFRSAYADNRVR
jgi:hypothetical protein